MNLIEIYCLGIRDWRPTRWFGRRHWTCERPCTEVEQKPCATTTKFGKFIVSEVSFAWSKWTNVKNTAFWRLKLLCSKYELCPIRVRAAYMKAAVWHSIWHQNKKLITSWSLLQNAINNRQNDKLTSLSTIAGEEHRLLFLLDIK
jgi:hypothetical protein